MIDVEYEKNLQVITKWLNKNYLQVEFKRCVSSFFIDELLITINSLLSNKNKIYELLHEIGHYLFIKNNKSKCFTSRNYIKQLNSENEIIDNSLLYKIEELEEEYEAWNRGRKLACRLKIKIDDHDFNKYKARQIKTYIDNICKKEKNKK